MKMSVHIAIVLNLLTIGSVISEQWLSLANSSHVYSISQTSMKFGECYNTCINTSYSMFLHHVPASDSPLYLVLEEGRTYWVQQSNMGSHLYDHEQFTRVINSTNTTVTYNGAADAFCICERPAGDLYQCQNDKYSMTKDIGNATSSIDMTPGKWLFSPSTCMDYMVTNRSYSKTGCVTFCSDLGNDSTLATFKDSIMDYTLRSEMRISKGVFYWIDHSSCSALFWPRVFDNQDCLKKLKCICQRYPAGNITISTRLQVSTLSGGVTTVLGQPSSTPILASASASPILSSLPSTALSTGDGAGGTLNNTGSAVQPVSTVPANTSVMQASTTGNSVSTTMSAISTLLVPSSTNQASPTSYSAPSTPTVPTLPNDTSSLSNSIPEMSAYFGMMFYVNTNKLQYSEAKAFCQTKLHADLISFDLTWKYVNITLDLKLLGGFYWVNDTGWNQAHNVCTSLQVSERGIGTVSTATCTDLEYSVCARVPMDTTSLTENEAFMTMIAELTVKGHETNKAKREKISIWDTRRSAHATGGTSLMIVLTLVVLIVLSDLPRLKEHCHVKRCLQWLLSEKAKTTPEVALAPKVVRIEVRHVRFRHPHIKRHC